MIKKLSFSAVSKYNQCPRSYKLHYIDRLRERSASSFLAFGSAIDQSLNAILSDLQKNKKITIDYKAIFDSHWQTITINKVQYELPYCTLVGYAKSEYVHDIITNEDHTALCNAIKQLAPELIENNSILEIKEKLEGSKAQRAYRHFKEDHHKLLNYMNYLSLRRKGHLMLEAYIRDIVPEIEEVIEIQKEIELPSEDGGTTFTGYIDAIVTFKGVEGNVILDNKTSGSFYSKDDVAQSQQLATYCYALDLKKAAFGVMLKKVSYEKTKTCRSCGYIGISSHKTCNNMVGSKRCGGEWDEISIPSCGTQLFIDTVPEQFQGIVVENYGEVTDAIKLGAFPRNLSTCNNLFGHSCPFIKYCLNGDCSNLEKLDE
jgi:hypothetical protein